MFTELQMGVTLRVKKYKEKVRRRETGRYRCVKLEDLEKLKSYIKGELSGLPFKKRK